MNLWRKILYWDSKVDQTPKNKLVNILTLIFSVSVICGALLSVTLRSVEINTINQIDKDIKKMELSRMNKLMEKAVQNKFK